MSPTTQDLDVTTLPQLKRQQRASYWENLFKKYEIVQNHYGELCDDVAVEDIGKAKSPKGLVKINSIANNKTNGRQKVAACTNTKRSRARYDLPCNANTETDVQKLEQTDTRRKSPRRSNTVIKTKIEDEISNKKLGSGRSTRSNSRVTINSNKQKVAYSIKRTKCLNRQPKRARYDLQSNTQAVYNEKCFSELEETDTRRKSPRSSNTVIKTKIEDEISNKKLGNRSSTRSNNSVTINSNKQNVAYSTKRTKCLNTQPKRARYNLRSNTQAEYNEKCFSELEETLTHCTQEKSPRKDNTSEISNKKVISKKSKPNRQCSTSTEGNTIKDCSVTLVKLEETGIFGKQTAFPIINPIKYENMNKTKNEKLTRRRAVSAPRCSSCFGTSPEGCFSPLIKVENNVAHGLATTNTVGISGEFCETNSQKQNGKRGRPRWRNNTKIKTEAENCYEAVIKVENNVAHGLATSNTVGISGEFCETNSQKQNGKRGRPRWKNNTKIKTEAENCYEAVINVENVAGTRKRRKPPTKHNTPINVKIETNGTCEISSGNAGRQKGRIPLKIEAKIEDIDETQNIKGNRRPRNSQNHTALGKNTYTTSKKKEIKAELNATPDELHLTRPKKHKMNTKTPPVTYQKYIVHSFCKKELEKAYPILLENRRSRSRSSHGDYKHGRNLRRSKSYADYSEQPLQVVNPFCPINNKNRNATNKKVRSPKLVQQTPFHENQINVYQNCDETNLVDSICDTSHFNTTLLDSDAVHTKSIIEEELKSNVGLLMVKRQYCINSTDDDKENNYAFWHNALKSEIIKLRRTISIEKLEQYMRWYMQSWFAPENNMEDYSKNESFLKANLTIP